MVRATRNVSEIAQWRGYSVEWHEGDRVILSRGNRLFRTSGVGAVPEYWVSVPINGWTAAALQSRLLQRLLRAMFYNVIPMNGNRLLTGFGRQLSEYDGNSWSTFSLPRPTRILRNCHAQTPDGRLWFGEYWDNANRDAMNIYCLEPGGQRCDVVFSFPVGAIYHVHSVTWDPYRQGLICLTGDRAGECQMLISFDGFRTFEVIGAGNEDWRAVSVVPVADGWLFATDAELQQNVIVHVDSNSGVRRILANIPGPVYYSKSWGEDILFSVTAERCEAMPEPRGSLVRVRGGNVETLISFDKDLGTSRLAWRTFLPGTLNFAGGAGHLDYLYASGVALRGADNRVFLIRRS